LEISVVCVGGLFCRTRNNVASSSWRFFDFALSRQLLLVGNFMAYFRAVDRLGTFWGGGDL